VREGFTELVGKVCSGEVGAIFGIEISRLARSNADVARLMEQTDLATAAEDVLDAARPGDRRVHATLEPAVISGDPVLAGRLIANLVDNAVRYNLPAGDVWISTRTIAGSSRLTVANTGPVISPADAGRIFQPSQRLHDRTSHDGFGFGLAVDRVHRRDPRRHHRRTPQSRRRPGHRYHLPPPGQPPRRSPEKTVHQTGR
jgi:light-regulated signal transduction histidine kinase (bacteriophytochrome)